MSTEYCPFVVGQHVVCVDDTLSSGVNIVGDLDGLTAGRVYTIRWVGIHESPRFGPQVCVRLREIVRARCPTHGDDMPFAAVRFRPAPSIEALKDLLVNAPSPPEKVDG